jgi:hydrogenase expression/formation protein HypD
LYPEGVVNPLLNQVQKERAKEIIAAITSQARELERPLTLMEVCGTHTVAIARGGIRELLPANIKLLSGPGCPVCVTDTVDLDAVIDLAMRPEVIIATYGDLVRVPGSQSCLQEKRGEGARVQVVYSGLDALQLAEQNPDSEVVMIGIGFETTAPATAVVVEQARQRGLGNFSVLSLHKVVPPALRALLTDPEVKIDALINPGHVCTILGSEPFRFVAEEFKRPCVITGFEPIDILEAIWLILQQYRSKKWQVDIQYRRAVRPEGNPIAREYLDRFFQPNPARWRGLGVIPESGLTLRSEFADWDAAQKLGVVLSSTDAMVELPEDSGDKAEIGAGINPGDNKNNRQRCICGAILKGQKLPGDCPSFGQACTPLRPVGPCMVSSEGACAAYYRFGLVKSGRNIVS